VSLSYLILAFFQFDNLLLLVDKTSLSNLEFILFRPNTRHTIVGLM